jgi:choline dehydrogenase-like flavoprotein
MLRDADTVKDGSVLNVDICVIGSGPAGTSVAHAFIGHPARVICLESGGVEAEDRAQLLNEGAFIGQPYAGLRRTRHRQLGGGTRVWNTPLNGEMGAKYVPLDSSDFAARPDPDYPGWPFDAGHLEDFYGRAQSFCGLGPFLYAGHHWCREQMTFPLPDGCVRRSVYQFGPARIFADHHLRAICRSDNVQLLFHATACALDISRPQRSSAIVDVGSLAGNRFRVESRLVVLAAGAVENARLLMASRAPGKCAPGDEHGWLGRGFMEHPRDYSMSLIARGPDVYTLAGFYDRHRAEDGTMIAGRLACDPATVVREGLPNASLTILPLLRRGTVPFSLLARFMGRVARRAGSPIPAGYGWSRHPEPERDYCGLRFIINVEQWPHPENRILLGQDTDRFGVPRPEVHWQWRAADQHRLDRVRTLFAEALRAADIGKVEIRGRAKPDPNAHHHAGTTRMHTDSRLGVVDADGLVYGTRNVYAAGASVFPTAGYANPTLTIVALSLRLADHLKQRL